MALASLGDVTFRINPNSIKWNFQINTSVTETIGGRVVQVVGATLSDIVVEGDYGQDHSQRNDDGLSWKLAEAFVEKMKNLMVRQSTFSKVQGQSAKTLPLLDFIFPDYGWHFGVYLKAISSKSEEASITHTVGNFSYGYRITLFIVEERGPSGRMLGSYNTKNNGIIDKKKNAAISSYIARISNGVGWKKSEFNDPQLIRDAATGVLTSTATTVDPVTGVPSESAAAAAATVDGDR